MTARWLTTLMVLVWGGAAVAEVAYVRSTIGSPWGRNENEMQLTAAFGADGWADLRFEEVDVAQLFGGQYTVIYLEGGDTTTAALEAFIDTHRDVMAAWLGTGNALFINAAPNDGDGLALGIGDARLVYPRTSRNPLGVASRTHPIFADMRGELTWSGGSAAHAAVSGTDVLPLTTDALGQVHLAWLPNAEGCGTAVFGGLTPTSFWRQEDEPEVLRIALLTWLGQQVRDCDADDDRVVDARDNCPGAANPDQADSDGDGRGDACDFEDDRDRDGVPDADDNCPWQSNPDQMDADGDGVGDVCDAIADPPRDDLDADGVANAADNCPLQANADQADADGDGQGDACDARDDRDLDADGLQNQEDNCPFIANPAQTDSDGDGVGDLCDGAAEAGQDDLDADGVPNGDDNCPLQANADQADGDSDGAGDACDTQDNDDLDGDGVPNVDDPCPFGGSATDAGAEVCASGSGGGGGGCGVSPARSGGWAGLLLCLVISARRRRRRQG